MTSGAFKLGSIASSFAAGAILLFVTGKAHADTALALDLDYAVPLDAPDGVDWGGGFAVRLGQQLHLPLLVLTPELAFNYQAFAGGADTAVYRGLAGMRLAVGEILRPGIYGHLGFGRLVSSVPGHSDGLSYDAGAFLDFTLLPLINIGAHVAYSGLALRKSEPAFDWVTVGLHAALVF
jgi:hypothetical protein